MQRLVSFSLLACLAAPTLAQEPLPDLPPPEAPTQEGTDPKPLIQIDRVVSVRLRLHDGKTLQGTLLEHTKEGYRLRVKKKGEVQVREDEVKAVHFEPARFNLDFSNAPLKDVCAQLSRAAKKTISVDDALADKRVTFMLRAIPWRDAVYVVAKMLRCEVEAVGETLLLTERQLVTFEVRHASLRSVLRLAGAYSGRSILFGPKVGGTINAYLKEVPFDQAIEALAWTASLDFESKRDLVRFNAREGGRAALPAPKPATSSKSDPSPRVTLELKNAPLSDALEKLSRAAKRDLLAAPGTEGKVTLTLRDAPLEDAIALIARQTGCTARRHPAGLWIFEQPPRVTLSASGVSAASWFMLLAEAAGKNVIVSPEVNARIEANLVSVPYGDAIEQSAKAYGYQVSKIHDVLIVSGKRFDPEAKVGGVKVGNVAVGPSKAAPTPSKAERAALQKQIQRLINNFDQLAKLQDVDGLMNTFVEIRDLMRRYARGSGAEVQAQLEAWKLRLREHGDLADSLLLSAFLQRGNELLKAVSEAFKAKDSSAALNAHAQVQQLASEMRQEKRAVFKRNADALSARADSLAEQALSNAGVLRVDAKTLHRPLVEAIAHAPEGRSTCVILGRVYAQGDTYVLPNGEQLAGVRVERIDGRWVELRLKDKKTLRLTLGR